MTQHPPEGPFSHTAGLAPIYVLELLLEQKEASAMPGSMCADRLIFVWPVSPMN